MTGPALHSKGKKRSLLDVRRHRVPRQQMLEAESVVSAMFRTLGRGALQHYRNASWKETGSLKSAFFGHHGLMILMTLLRHTGGIARWKTREDSKLNLSQKCKNVVQKNTLCFCMSATISSALLNIR